MSSITTSRTNPKKARKPQERTLPLIEAIMAIASEYDRMTIRSLYYQLVSRGSIEKTEVAYRRVCDISGQMRLTGTLSYGKIADGNCQRRNVAQWGGPAELLEADTGQYRKDRWKHHPWHVEAGAILLTLRADADERGLHLRYILPLRLVGGAVLEEPLHPPAHISSVIEEDVVAFVQFPHGSNHALFRPPGGLHEVLNRCHKSSIASYNPCIPRGIVTAARFDHVAHHDQNAASVRGKVGVNPGERTAGKVNFSPVAVH